MSKNENFEFLPETCLKLLLSAPSFMSEKKIVQRFFLLKLWALKVELTMKVKAVRLPPHCMKLRIFCWS